MKVRSCGGIVLWKLVGLPQEERRRRIWFDYGRTIQLFHPESSLSSLSRNWSTSLIADSRHNGQWLLTDRQIPLTSTKRSSTSFYKSYFGAYYFKLGIIIFFSLISKMFSLYLIHKFLKFTGCEILINEFLIWFYCCKSSTNLIKIKYASFVRFGHIKRRNIRPWSAYIKKHSSMYTTHVNNTGTRVYSSIIALCAHLPNFLPHHSRLFPFCILEHNYGKQ